MNKKLLALILGTAMTVGLLTACGGDKQADTPAPTPVATETSAPAPSKAPTSSKAPTPSKNPNSGSGQGQGQGSGNKKPSTSLAEPLAPLVGPVSVPSAFADGTYRIVAGEAQLTREGSVVYSDGSIQVWPIGGSAATSESISTAGPDEPLHYIFQSIGANSSFTVKDGKISAITLRPPTFGTTERNAKYLDAGFMDGVKITVACNSKQSPQGGAVTPTDTSIILSDTLTDITIDLDGSTESVDLSKADGKTFNYKDDNGDRTFTVANNGDGTITIAYTVK